MTNNENTRNSANRRRFLKNTGIAATALTLPGTVAAKPGNGKGKQNPSEERVAEAHGSVSVGPDTKGLSKDEHDAYVASMRQKYGDQGVWGIQPESDGITTQDTTPGTLENLTYINAWTMHLEATDSLGTVQAESDNQIALYKSDVTDEYGREHYFYWHWTSGRSRDYVDFTGNLYNMWNRLSLKDGNDMLAYDPDTDLSRNGKTYTVSLAATYQGVGVGISGDFTLFSDKVRPHPNYTEVGNNGVFAVQWAGDYEGTQSFNGASEERRPVGNSRSFNWDCYLKAGRYAKI